MTVKDASDAEFLFEIFQCDEIFHPARFTISLGLAYRVLFIITQIVRIFVSLRGPQRQRHTAHWP